MTSPMPKAPCRIPPQEIEAMLIAYFRKGGAIAVIPCGKRSPKIRMRRSRG